MILTNKDDLDCDKWFELFRGLVFLSSPTSIRLFRWWWRKLAKKCIFKCILMEYVGENFSVCWSNIFSFTNILFSSTYFTNITAAHRYSTLGSAFKNAKKYLLVLMRINSILSSYQQLGEHHSSTWGIHFDRVKYVKEVVTWSKCMPIHFWPTQISLFESNDHMTQFVRKPTFDPLSNCSNFNFWSTSD